MIFYYIYAMRVKYYGRELKVESPSLFLKGGERAILLIHGFTGIPERLSFLAHAFHEQGYTVSVPRLPGHGTNGIDFSRTNSRDWIRRCFDSCLELREQHEDVVIGGLSMGGLLAIIMAEHFNNQQLLLYAPALTTHFSVKIFLAHCIAPFVKRIPSSTTAQDEDIPSLQSDYRNYDWPRQIVAFEKIRRLALRALPGLQCRILSFFAEHDTMIPFRAHSILHNQAKNCQIDDVIFNNSQHVLTSGADKEEVAAQSIRWLEQDHRM